MMDTTFYNKLPTQPADSFNSVQMVNGTMKGGEKLHH